MDNKNDIIFCFFCNEKIESGAMCNECEVELIDYYNKEKDYFNN